MSITISQAQLDQIKAYYDAGIAAGSATVGAFAPAYQYLLELAKGQSSGVDPASIAWLTGAVQITAGIGSYSTLIRDYTSAQYKLRYGEISDSELRQKIQAASNGIAINVVKDAVESAQLGLDGSYVFTIPGIEKIGNYDAAPTAAELFNGDFAGWSGNPLFLFFADPLPFYQNILTPGNSYNLFAMLKAFDQTLDASSFSEEISNFFGALGAQFSISNSASTVSRGEVDLVNYFNATYNLTGSMAVTGPGLWLANFILGRVDVGGTIDGTDGNDYINGGPNDDIINYSASGGTAIVNGDLIDGGGGYNTVDYSAVAGSIKVMIDEKASTATRVLDVGRVSLPNSFSNDSLYNIQKVIGTSYKDIFSVRKVVAENPVKLDGGGNHDTLEIVGIPYDKLEFIHVDDNLVVIDTGDNAAVDDDMIIVTLESYFKKLYQIDNIVIKDEQGQVAKRVKVVGDVQDKFGWGMQIYTYTPTILDPSVSQLAALTIEGDDGNSVTKTYGDPVTSLATEFVLVPGLPSNVTVVDIQSFAQGVIAISAQAQQGYELLLFSGASTTDATSYFRDMLTSSAESMELLGGSLVLVGTSYGESLAFVNGALDWWTGTAGGQAIYIDLVAFGPNGGYSDGDNIAAVERGFGSLIASIGGLVSNYGGSVGQTAVGYNDLVALEAVLLSAGVQAQNIAFFYNAVTTGVGTIAPGAATDKFGGVFSATITAMQAMLQALANTPGGGATMLSPILSEAAMLASLIKSDITNLTMLTYGTGPEVQALVADINGIVFSDFDNTPLLLQEFSAVLGNFKGLAGGGSGIASIEGTTGDDVLAGLASADTINGNNGNDTITGAGGADVLNGGNGDDVFIVNAGDVMTGATIDGGAGDDTILMTGGGDLSAAAVSNVETLQVGGAVTLTAAQLAGFVGLTGGGTLTAAAAGTFDLGIKAGANIINLTGSAGDDVLSGDGNAQILDGGDGNDTLMGGGGADTLLGGNGDDVFIVTTGDVVTGATIDGGAGANILAATNADISAAVITNVQTLQVGGNVTLTAAQLVAFTALTGAGTLVASAAGIYDLGGKAGANLINLTGSTGIDILTGDANGQTLDGGAGNDTLNGLDGDDTLIGGAGVDKMFGGNGDDIFVVNAGDVVIGETYNGGAGTNILAVGNGTNITAGTFTTIQTLQLGGSVTLKAAQLMGFTALTGAGTLIAAAAGIYDLGTKAGANIINLTGSGGADILTGDGNAQTLSGGAGIDTLNGMGGDDILLGGAGGDTLNGGDGNDTLTGGTGADSMNGGAGDDIFVVSGTDIAAGETIDGGTGSNTLNATGINISAAVLSNVQRLQVGGNVTLTAAQLLAFAELTGAGTLVAAAAGTFDLGGKAGTYVMNLTGSTGADTLIGDAQGQILSGGAGIDTLNGMDGNDTLIGGTGADIMNGGSGDDIFQVSGTEAATGEIIDGGAGNNTLLATNATISGAVISNVQILQVVTGAKLSAAQLAGFTALTGGGTLTAAAAGIYDLGGKAGTNSFNLTGSTGKDTLIGDDNAQTLSGGNGNDTLFGLGGNDILDGGIGTDTLTGGLGDDNYNFALGYGSDTIIENDATAGNTDILNFGAGVARDQIWFTHTGNNLVLQIIGTTDKMTIKDWYSGNADHVEQIKTAAGDTLFDTQVQNLVNAMAGMTVPSTTTLTIAQHAVLDPVIAANWA